MSEPLPSEADCPECGATPTDESIVRSRLSAHGYLHEDKFLECSECSNRWTLGIPRGEPDGDRWVCDGCGGDLIPHFGSINLSEEVLQVRPKCRDCYWVPDDRIELDLSGSGDVRTFFFEHHSTTGDTEKADKAPFE